MKRLNCEKRLKFSRHELTIPIRGALKTKLHAMQILRNDNGVKEFLERVLSRVHKVSKEIDVNSNHYRTTIIYKTNSWDDVKMWKEIEKAIPNKDQRFDVVSDVVEEMLREEGLVE